MVDRVFYYALSISTLYMVYLEDLGTMKAVLSV